MDEEHPAKRLTPLDLILEPKPILLIIPLERPHHHRRALKHVIPLPVFSLDAIIDQSGNPAIWIDG